MAPRPTHLVIGGREVPLRVRKIAHARRMTLRLDAAEDGVALTLPRWVSIAEGIRFAESKRSWLERRLASLPERRPFSDGALVPVGGTDHRIRHVPHALPMVMRAPGELVVGGGGLELAGRVAAWLREEARALIHRLVAEKVRVIGEPMPAIALRDTRSLWGSCSPRRKLSFTWRLVLAPPHVLDYVVAHEVAHLKHMNHGARFWALVEKLTAETEAARAWLRRDGAGLHRYG